MASYTFTESNELEKRFVCYFYFVGWDCISFGLHVCITLPNIEIHLPFGFIRIGQHLCDGVKHKNVYGFIKTEAK